MGLYISGTAIGGMSGRLIAGVLLDFISWQTATMIMVCLTLSLLLYFILPCPLHGTSSLIRSIFRGLSSHSPKICQTQDLGSCLQKAFY